MTRCEHAPDYKDASGVHHLSELFLTVSPSFTPSVDYAAMCNIPWGGGRRPYGNDALVAGPVHEYEASPDYLPSPEQQLGPTFDDNEECEYQSYPKSFIWREALKHQMMLRM